MLQDVSVEISPSAVALFSALGIMAGTIITALVTKRGQDKTAGGILITQLMARVDTLEARLGTLEADHLDAKLTILDFSGYVVVLWGLLTGHTIPPPPPRVAPLLPQPRIVPDPQQDVQGDLPHSL